MSQRCSAAMSLASCSRVSFFARPAIAAGSAPPALLVLKNIGSMSAKSPSARMRSISTEPTMPRQPTNPTRGFAESAISVLPFRGCGPLGLPARFAGVQEGARRSESAQLLVMVLVVLPVSAATTASPISRVPTLLRALAPDVGRAQAGREHGLHRRLDAVGRGRLVERVTKHHGGGQNCSQRVCNTLTGDVGRAAVAGLVQALVVLVQRGAGQHADASP